MFRFFTKTLMRQAAFSLLLVSAGPVLTGWLIVTRISGDALKKITFSHLSAVNEIKKNQTIDYLRKKMNRVRVLSESNSIKNIFELLHSYRDAAGKELNGPFRVESKNYEAIFNELDIFFKKNLELHEYHDVYLFCDSYGYVQYSVTRKQDFETYFRSGAYNDGSGLAKLWANVLKHREPAMVDFSEYCSNGEPSALIGSPVFDQKGEIFSVLAFLISAEQINPVLQQKTVMGKDVATYLVGKDFLMRSDPEFENVPTILKTKADTVAVRKALKQESGTGMAKDYRGVKVLSSYSYLGLNKRHGTDFYWAIDFDWAIISEINKTRAFAPIRALVLQISLVVLTLLVVSFIVGYFIARSITRPIEGLSGKIELITDGDLTVGIPPVNRADELGILIRAFHKMLDALYNQTRQIMEGTNTLAFSISQISAAATQLAVSSSETSVSLSEIGTTVQEVKQTAHIASEKAGHVAKSAEAVSRVSDEGKKVTKNAITGIKRIKQEMEYIDESIVKLSDQTRSIEEIISAVNDVADQSNILSVNASIQASKAGEHGKGFAVVAQEVKSLARQSKEATDQVRSILNDIQKAIRGAVSATERGSKAVEAGVELADIAGGAINVLTNSAEEAAQTFVQLAALSRQQLSGMNHLVQAMETIKTAGIQNVDNAKQLDAATLNLEDLGKKLKKLTEKFRV